MERKPRAMDRVSGLDSIRFICALWVYLGHGAAPALPNPFADGSLANFAFRGFFGNIWSGPAAVIVFFVISGFCIHYPFAGSDKRPRLKEFYTRRFLRLLVPVAAAIPLSALIGVRLTLFQDSILWSLLAELIYYICYPLLRAAHLRFGSWRGIVIASFAIAFAVAATNPSAGNYPSYGPGFNWLLGLPCWLLGCLLAESARRKYTPPCFHNCNLGLAGGDSRHGLRLQRFTLPQSDWLPVDSQSICCRSRSVAPTGDRVAAAHRSTRHPRVGRLMELFLVSYSRSGRRIVFRTLPFLAGRRCRLGVHGAFRILGVLCILPSYRAPKSHNRPAGCTKVSTTCGSLSCTQRGLTP